MVGNGAGGVWSNQYAQTISLAASPSQSGAGARNSKTGLILGFPILTHYEDSQKPYWRQACDREKRCFMDLLSPRVTQEEGKRGKDGKVFIDTVKLPPCLLPLKSP